MLKYRSAYHTVSFLGKFCETNTQAIKSEAMERKYHPKLEMIFLHQNPLEGGQPSAKYWQLLFDFMPILWHRKTHLNVKQGGTALELLQCQEKLECLTRK